MNGAPRRARRSGELDRRQVLEHEVPLPALRRVRRLQPVPRGDRASRTRASTGPRTADCPRARRRRRSRRPRSSRRSASRRATARRSTKICQSSCASPGALIARAAACSMPWPLTYDPSFSTHDGPGQHDVGGLRERRHQHALDDEERQPAVLLRVDDPRDVADVAFGTGIEDVERRDASLLDARAERADVRRAAVGPRPGSPGRGRR